MAPGLDEFDVLLEVVLSFSQSNFSHVTERNIGLKPV